MAGICASILFIAQAVSIEKVASIPKLMHGLNHDAQIVTQHLAKRLIYLCRESATPQALTKL